MYDCFCASPELQGYFIQCARSTCGSNADAAIQFGVDLCKGKAQLRYFHIALLTYNASKITDTLSPFLPLLLPQPTKMKGHYHT